MFLFQRRNRSSLKTLWSYMFLTGLHTILLKQPFSALNRKKLFPFPLRRMCQKFIQQLQTKEILWEHFALNIIFFWRMVPIFLKWGVVHEPFGGSLCLFKLETHWEHQMCVASKIHKCWNDLKLRASNKESHTQVASAVSSIQFWCANRRNTQHLQLYPTGIWKSLLVHGS